MRPPISAAAHEPPPPPADDHDPQPAALVWTVWGMIVVAGIALALLRVMAVNLPWHLATARLALETGHLAGRQHLELHVPRLLYQRYPAFQFTMWTILRIASWAGLGVATSVGWVLGFLLIALGRDVLGARFHCCGWWGCGLQRRMVLRPTCSA
jgi:hypothetical protein